MPALEPHYVQDAACRCGLPPEECIPGDMVLTQQTWTAGTYRDGPREGIETEVSMLRGRWTVKDACEYVRPSAKPLSEAKLARADVRYTTAQQLRDAGFAVVHTPGKKFPNGPHVSIVWPNENPLQNQTVPWPPKVSTAFAACFNGDEGDDNEP
jgi:hypothetical protein